VSASHPSPWQRSASLAAEHQVEQHGIAELVDIEPILAAYVETLQASAAKPTVKQHLAAVRMLFDWLVIGQVLAPTRPMPSAVPSMS
jgi:hypothetical protein